jgi:KUP system potassium uptake protein
VTGTLVLTSALFIVLARMVWRVDPWRIAVYAVVVVALETLFLGANLTKILHGGWLPVLIAAAVVLVMTTWRRGSEVLHEEERQLGGPIEYFVAIVRDGRVPRVPGVAIYPHPDGTTVPLALRSNVDFNHVVHEHVVLVSVVNENVPHIRHKDRVNVDDLGTPGDGIVHVAIRVGFTDSQDIPRGLALAVGRTPELEVDLDQAHYFLSVITVHATGPRGIRTWRKRLYAWLYHIQANRTEVFHLPPERTVVMGAQLDL